MSNKVPLNYKFKWPNFTMIHIKLEVNIKYYRGSFEANK